MNMQYDLKAFAKKVKKHQEKERYEHTKGVMYTAAALAMAYGCDLEKARVAGLLHDCAKCIPDEKKIKLCEKNKIEISEIEAQAPFLLHAKLGAFLAKEKYQVEEEEILSSIRWHTTGKADMTMLEKIIYIADYIEPNREKAPNLAKIRQTAFYDIDECMYEILRDTLEYLGKNPKTLDPETKDAFEFYRQLHETKQQEKGERFMTSKELAKLACDALDDKKALEIKVINIENVSTLADYFIIASGTNHNQVQAMADNVDETLGRAGYEPKQIEGYQNANWILMDYRDIVIHIFDEENRLFYDLERIWRDGTVVEVEDLK